MIVLGLIGRPDIAGVHDAAACLLMDGKVLGALEQERVSRRRYARGEGPEGAVRTLLDAHGLHPSDVQAIGYAWSHAPEDVAEEPGTGIPCGVHRSDALTATILPGIAAELGCRDICFFDHHLCHAVSAYCLNSEIAADVLVADGWGGDGSTSLFHVDRGEFRLLERYDKCWSLGMFYGAAAAYATLGWFGGGKLMGLSSYGRADDTRFMRFDPGNGGFRLGERVRSMLDGEMSWDRLSTQWLEVFEVSVFPYTSRSANAFDYAPFAASVQATLEDLGLGLAEKLRRLSGEDALLLSGGVALNAHMNSRIASESGYRRVRGTVAPNDGGTVFGAAFLAASLLGEPLRPLDPGDAPPIFFGPPVTAEALQRAMSGHATEAETLEGHALNIAVAGALGEGKIVAWFDGPSEFGPRALGARSLLAAPQRRTTLDRLNRVKGREAWRPAALSLTAEGFRSLDMEAPVIGLSDYMLCTHLVGPGEARRAIAGVHVDGTTRGQFVGQHSSFGALLEAVGEQSGLEAVVNTSLNTRGEPMVLVPEQAVQMLRDVAEIDMLVAPPYVVHRS